MELAEYAPAAHNSSSSLAGWMNEGVGDDDDDDDDGAKAEDWATRNPN